MGSHTTLAGTELVTSAGLHSHCQAAMMLYPAKVHGHLAWSSAAALLHCCFSQHCLRQQQLLHSYLTPCLGVQNQLDPLAIAEPQTQWCRRS
jgi:hypothetical protein